MVDHSQSESQWSVFSYALLQAAAQGDIEAVSDCLEHGAYIDVTDPLGKSPLILASSTPYKSANKVVTMLLACDANVSHHDNHNNTAVHKASEAGNYPILVQLKNAGAPMDSCNLSMQTPLHFSKNKDITALLMMNGTKIHAEDISGNTPLINFTLRNDIQSAEILLKYNANPITRNKHGINAVSIAWEHKLTEMLHLFYQYNTKNHVPTDGSDDFEHWLTIALVNTPSAFHRDNEKAYATRTDKQTIILTSEEESIPYFSLMDLEKELKKPMDEDRPRYLKQMKEAGNMRILKQVPDSFNFDTLRKNFPNFDKVSDFLECQIELCRLSPKKIAAFQPMLLLGDPGVGKTRYLLEVSKLLNLEFGLVQCGGVSANFIMSGSSTSWKNGKPGKIHTTIRDGKTINPIIMLDEVDKLAGSVDYDAHGPLYQLLEKRTALTFQDECIDIPMDCSHIIWVATANHINMIPEAIISRLIVIDIPTPSGEQLIQITKSIYGDVISEHLDTWGERFNPELHRDVLETVNELTPREIRKLLLTACGNAALRSSKRGNFTGQVNITVEDFGTILKSNKQKKIGFSNNEQNKRQH